MKKSFKTAFVIFEIIILIGVVAYLVINSNNKNRADSDKEIAQEIVQELEEASEDVPDPDEVIKPTFENEWELLLVNPWNEIPEGYVDELTIGDTEGYPVDVRVQEALEEMLAACRDAGHRVQIISAFRDHGTQQYLYNTTANKDDTAYPGTSEHECGLAVDIIDSSSLGWSDPLIKEQETLEGQKWLMENCRNYGFILRYPEDKEDITGIIYEPWHYRYVGRDHAVKIMESGQCLEEYLGRIDNDKEKIKDK